MSDRSFIRASFVLMPATARQVKKGPPGSMFRRARHHRDATYIRCAVLLVLLAPTLRRVLQTRVKYTLVILYAENRRKQPQLVIFVMEMQQLTIAADQQRWIAAPKAESTAAAEKDHCDTPEVDLCWGTLARG
eukprot:1195601-Prorocentrum_minimum.AAC.7